MYKIVILFLVLVASFSFFSCDNEVDMNTDYEDISIVYGLLDQSANRQYIKLNKAFLVEGNIYTGAADPALSQYNPDDIEMYIDEYSTTSWIRTIPLDTIMIENKDSGIFYYPKQILWATPENTVLKENYHYELYIKIKSLNKELRASTNLVKDFGIAKPILGTRFLGLTGTLPITVEWRAAENGKLHQLSIRFYYTEVNAQMQKTVHFVDMPMNIKRTNTTAGNEKISIDYYGESFFKNLAAKIKLPETDMVRYPDSVQYIISVADETFTVYMDVNKPSTGVITEKPAYTNIENGLGVFAGRYNKIRRFEGLATLTIDSLMHGVYTNKLGFKNYPNP